MLSYAKKLTKGKFVRNVAIVATGTAGAQAITMAFAPIITRLYGPEAFGLLGVFMALLAIFVPVAALTYPIAIVLPETDTDAKGIAKLSFRIAIIMSILAATILLIGGKWLLAMLGSESIAPYVMLIPASMFFAACMQIAQQWLIRKKEFIITARVAVLQAIILNSAKTGIGWFYPVGAVLVILAILGQGLHAAMLWTGIKKSRSVSKSQEGGQASLKELAKRHRDFPIYRAPQTTLNAISQSLPLLALSSFFGPSAAGFYTLSKMVLGVPVMLIGQSISTVFYPKINEAYINKQDTYAILVKAVAALAAIGLLPLLIVSILGPLLFEIFFGVDWKEAGVYAQWMAIWFYFMLITRPIISSIPVLSIQKFFLCYQMVVIATNFCALFIGYYFYNSSIISVALFSLVGCVMYIFLTIKVLMKAKIATTSQHLF